MKARPVPTRKQIERVAEQCSHEIIECLQDENAISLIATMRFFGLGKKRVRDYLNFLAEVKAEFGRYGKEGILKIKVEEEISAVGIRINEIYEQPESIKEVLRQKRVQKKSVSMAEAYDISKKLDAMREFQKCGGKLSEKRI